MKPESPQDKAKDNELSQEASDEQALISCCFIDGIPPNIPKGGFLFQFNNSIHAAMLKIASKGKAINFRSVGAQMSADPGWAKAGGDFVDLSEYHELLINPMAEKWYLEEIVLERYQKREAGRIGMEIAHRALDPSRTTQSVLAMLREGADDLSADHGDGAMSFADLMPLERERFHKDVESGERETFLGVPTSIPGLNRLIGGLAPGRLYVVAARPGVGKTSLAHDMTLSLARAGKKTLLISVEMLMAEITARMVSNITGISPKAWVGREDRMGKYQADQATRTLEGLPIVVSDSKNCTDLDIDNLVCIHKPQALVVDYLQVLTSAVTQENRNLEVGHLTRMFKQRAMAYKMPVIILSQFSRKGEGRRPVLSDLRDSGSIEQDADVVIFLHRDSAFVQDEDDDDEKPMPTEIHVAKNRHGMVGCLHTLFLPHRCCFAGASNRDEEKIPF